MAIAAIMLITAGCKDKSAVPTTAQHHVPAAQANMEAQALPQLITDFLQQQFPDATVAFVESSNKRGSLEYDVTLNDGTEVDFDLDNQWEEIDCKVKAVPAVLVPPAIVSYVKTLSLKDLIVTKIARKRYGYAIELNNGLDLKFDSKGQFIGLDD